MHAETQAPAANEEEEKRVGSTPEVSIPTSQTTPTTVAMAPKNHQRITGNNVPMTTLSIERPTQPKQGSPRLNPGVEVIEVATAQNSERIPMATLIIIS